jgi:hypothetical protein
MQDLLAGQIDLMIDQVPNSLQHALAGKIRAYAVTAKTRVALGPDVPTVDEAGLPGFHISVWHALWAPKGTPQDAITKLETLVTGMTGGSLTVARTLAEKFPWQDYRTVIDIGTAEGCLPVQIATAHSHITGGGFDLPPVEALFNSYVEKHDLSRRLLFHAGDFLHDPLPRADVLVLGRVLHNWDLSTKKLLLKKAHEALPSGGALIVYERLIDHDRRVNASALLASLNMLIVTAGGFDFTGTDCTNWMHEAGFHSVRVEPLTSEISMVTGLR